MSLTIPITVALVLLTLAGPASALELENLQTPATSGTNGGGTMGKLSGTNLSTGNGAPASEDKRPPGEPVTKSNGSGGVPAGGENATKELFQH